MFNKTAGQNQHVGMLKNFRNIAVVGFSTGISRILGLVRDVLLYAGLGAGVWSSAFLLAFTLPNLFRRLLGEGALTSALIPVMGRVLARNGRPAAFGFFNAVAWRVLLALSILALAGMLFLGGLVSSGITGMRWSLAGELSVLLLPYMPFVCLAAVFAAGLNVMGRFSSAAVTPVVLNLCMIGSLGGAMLLGRPPEQMVYWLCAGVLLGGVLQLFLPAIDFARQGWRPGREKADAASLADLRKLLLPALVGAGILQVNIMVSRLLAHSLNDSAVSVLYLASRLMELPLGLFTLSVATVFFPLMTESLARKENDSFVDAFSQGMRLILAISLPAGAGLLVLGEPIVELLRFGSFEGSDASMVGGLVGIYGIGLPFYSVATFATRGLHAAKAISYTVRVAGICLVVNLTGSLVLMQFWGERGLAAANVLAAAVQAILLCQALTERHDNLHPANLLPAFCKVIASTAFMAIACFGGLLLLNTLGIEGKAHALIAVAALIPGSIAAYFLLLNRLGYDELNLLFQKGSGQKST